MSDVATTSQGTTVPDNESQELEQGQGEAVATVVAEAEKVFPQSKQSISDDEIEQKVIGPVVQQINDRMTAMTETVTSAVMQKVDERLEKLVQPTEAAEARSRAMFGGTHQNPNRSAGIREGENVMTSRRYSYFKAMKAVLFPDEFGKDATVEIALSHQLSDYYDNRNFKRQALGRKSILVPFGSAMLPDDIDNVNQSGNDSIPLDQMGDLLADPYTMQHALSLRNNQKFRESIGQSGIARVNQALSIFDDTGMGIFADSQISEIIELVRKLEVFSRIGAREVTLPPNGFLPMGRQTGAATGAWIGEGATITTSEPTTGNLELRAKKAAGLVIVPNELFRFSTMDTEGFLRADLARVLALLLDLAGLEGVGSTAEPKGIINRTGTNGNVILKVAGTVGTNGDTLEPNDPSGLMAEVEENDHDIDGRGFAWIMRGKLWQNILNRRADAVSANDEAGAYLFALNREAIQNGMPGQMMGWPVVKSSQVSNTRVKGTGTDLSYLLGGIPDDIIIGRVGVLEFTLGTEGTVSSTNLFETDQSALRAIEHADFAMRHESSWGFIDDIDMALPTGVI